MANIHVNGNSNPSLNVGGQANARVSTGNTSMPKYVGARAEVTRTEEGVRIWLKDYLGETEEIVADGSPGADGTDGEDGEDGVGIASITKTGTSGLVDTYTITYTDSTTSTFTVTNGQDGTVTDVQVDGSSVVTDGVASIGTATSSLAGVMSSTDKSKLDGIGTGAERNVVTDVTQVTVSGTGSNAIRITARTLGDNTTTYNVAPTTSASESKAGLMSATDKTKLNGIASKAEVNVQSDWNESDTTSDAYIANKPTIPTVPTNVSAFTNDAGYLTLADLPIYNGGVS